MAESKRKVSSKSGERNHFNESRWQSVFENMAEIVMVIDRKFQILTMNHEQQGFTRENTIGKNLFEYVPPTKKRKIEKQLAQLIKTGKSFDDENLITGMDGTYAWYKTVYGPIRSISGSVNEIIVISHDITAIKSAEDRVLNAVFDGQESERRRLSAELHDGLGQYISAIGFGLFQLEQLIPDSNSLKHTQILEGLKAMVDKAGTELKSVTHNLSPQNLEQYGLVAATRDYCSQVAHMFGITVRFKALNLSKRLEPEIEITLFRLIQELLNNIVKHANCSVADIRLRRDSNSLLLSVTDNGKGFKLSSKSKGLGLLNLKNRIKPFNGSVQIVSEIKQGSTVIVSIPLKNANSR